MQVRTLNRSLKTLDFDIENRPLNYGGMDFTFAEVTAIAASWVGSDEIFVWMLDKRGEESMLEMLEGFKALYDEADVVTGHYLRGHDLPHVNGAFMEFGLEPLSSKLVSCTKSDLYRSKGLSKSQESLGSMYGIEYDKYHMNQTMWRSANRLEPIGIKYCKDRVVGDIKQHKAIRERLILERWLKGPQRWKP